MPKPKEGRQAGSISRSAGKERINLGPARNVLDAGYGFLSQREKGVPSVFTSRRGVSVGAMELGEGTP